MTKSVEHVRMPGRPTSPSLNNERGQQDVVQKLLPRGRNFQHLRAVSRIRKAKAAVRQESSENYSLHDRLLHSKALNASEDMKLLSEVVYVRYTVVGR